jgi:hypothetical protein
MRASWNGNQTKFAAFAIGIGLLLGTYTPQTSENLATYMSQRGYSQIAVEPASTSCGRGRSRFAFRARSPNGLDVRGDVCMASYAFMYSFNEYAK